MFGSARVLLAFRGHISTANSPSGRKTIPATLNANLNPHTVNPIALEECLKIGAYGFRDFCRL